MDGLQLAMTIAAKNIAVMVASMAAVTSTWFSQVSSLWNATVRSESLFIIAVNIFWNTANSLVAFARVLVVHSLHLRIEVLKCNFY